MRLGDREWRARQDRERESFDRMFRIMWPVVLVLGIAGAIASIVLYAAGAAWLWSVIP
jgi:hypothetical protein